MIGSQLVDPSPGLDPLGLLLPGRADSLSLLNVDLEVPQAESLGLAEVPLAHIAAQVNALAQTVRDMVPTHVCLVDVLLPGRDPSFDEPVLDGSEALIVLTHGWHDFHIGDEPRPLVCGFCHLQLVAHPSLTTFVAIPYFRIMRVGDHVSFGLSWRAGFRLAILSTGELLS
jgi:hypothetical protein